MERILMTLINGFSVRAFRSYAPERPFFCQAENMKVNPFKDQLAMYLLSTGDIEVDKDGVVWKMKVRDGRTPKAKYKSSGYYGRTPKVRDIKPNPIGHRMWGRCSYTAIHVQFNKKSYSIFGTSHCLDIFQWSYTRWASTQPPQRTQK
ncbi:hypothetical protein LCGC14_2162290 [marine sediment metagenome]|uniref:Uncharacterized protein n=1 Tax=marine sediment metagenome TaxID=412755 RepID=A0A0F9DSG9_9ZZZZ